MARTATEVLMSAVNDVPAGRILVAVSGGPDSVALLRALHQAGRELRIGHVNHMLRGEESDEDEQFVRELGRRLGIEVGVCQLDVQAEAKRSKQSIETTARSVRHRALRAMLARWPGDLIALGHNLDDQSETVLMHLLRGSGTAGLRGMPPRRGPLVRPLLSVPRSVISEALREWDQPYRSDPSNEDPRFTRNRVRKRLVPALEQISPGAVTAIVRAGQLAQVDADFIEREADRAFGTLCLTRTPEEIVVNRSGWLALHPALRTALVRRVIRALVGSVEDIDERHVAAMLAAIEDGTPVREQLPKSLRIMIRPNEAVVRLGASDEPGPIDTVSLSVPGQAATRYGELTAQERKVTDLDELRRLVAVCGPFNAWCDLDAVGDQLSVRPRREGDRLEPLGSSGSRKLQDLFVDAHVPAADRSTIPIVDNGKHVVWIPGFALDRRAGISPDTTRVLHLIWRLEQPKY